MRHFQSIAKSAGDYSMGTVTMPKLGETMRKGKIVKWLKKEGDSVEEGEPLLEVETEKVVFEVTAPIDGTIRKIVAFEGDDVPVEQAIAFIEELR